VEAIKSIGGEDSQTAVELIRAYREGGSRGLKKALEELLKEWGIDVVLK